jgi:hypothetical protein
MKKGIKFTDFAVHWARMFDFTVFDGEYLYPGVKEFYADDFSLYVWDALCYPLILFLFS